MGIGLDPTGGDRITLMGIHPRNDRDSVQPCQINSAPTLSKTLSLSIIKEPGENGTKPSRA